MIHSRSIHVGLKTDFINQVKISPRQENHYPEKVTRTFIEIDGRRHQLGLPAELLRGLLLSDPEQNSVTKNLNSAAEETITASNQIPAPISGILQSWYVQEGDEVKQGDVIAVMEAMKMETQLTAHRSGKIIIHAEKGSYQQAGNALASINED